MTTVEEIKDAIEHLPVGDFSSLRDWMSEKGWDLWDQQLEHDSRSGKLDAFIETALDEKRNGDVRPL
jgi:hypothetical protein